MKTPSIVLTALAVIWFGCGKMETASQSANTATADPYTFDSDKNFLTDFEPSNADGAINVVVEIPAGSNAKWEVTKPDGVLKWEFKKGKPRVVKYLPYPGNYGMVPRTLLPKELGGDGDPLDVIVLGPAVARGSVISARLVGVLRLLDGGEQDDKLLAVAQDSPLAGVHNLAELRSDFKGVLSIIETWFANYKGPGEMQANGFGDVDEAQQILRQSMKAYSTQQVAGASFFHTQPAF